MHPRVAATHASLAPHASLATLAVLVVLVAAAPATATARAACDPGPALLLDGLGTPEEDLARLAQLVGAAPIAPDLVRRGGPRVVTLCAGGESFGWLGRAVEVAPLVPRQAPHERGSGEGQSGEGGALVLRQVRDERTSPWTVALLPVRLDGVWNSTYPSGALDGLLWAGRGASTLLRAGAVARAGPLTVTFAPEVAWQQNAWFRTVPTGQPGNLAFANPWYGASLDLPQRFGAGPFATAGLGQSSVRLELHGAAAGVSTENLWLGPGTRNALLMTNEGPGFPHAFLGTSAPVDFGIGGVEALAVWGRLDRSRYSADTSHPWITALAIDWSPRWVPGLSVGAGRVFVETWASLKADALLSVLQPPLKSELPGGDNPRDNQVASLWYRWVFPESALELYGEWGRDDFPASLAGLVREPERTAAWTAGLQKLWPAGSRAVRLQIELARLHETRPVGSSSGMPVFYTHGDGLGYTNGGQLLGAPAGPGGDAQFLGIDAIGAGGRIGGYLARTRRNEEIFWTVIDPQHGSSDHDVELAAGLRQVLFAGPCEVAWDLGLAFRWSRDFGRNEPNVRAGVSIAMPMGR